MKAQFIDKLVSTSWSISRLRGRALLTSIVQRLRSDRPAEDKWGNPLPKMQIVGDIAVIPIVGALTMNIPDWVKSYGLDLTDINDIEQELSRALNEPGVTRIALDFDSPGGWSVAGNKLFDLVQAANLRKPVLAWCADGAECCSAAYQGACPAQLFLTGPYAAAVGCIGTYLTVLNDTEYWKELGITWEVFRSGELKGIGDDGFSDPQKAFLQSMVDRFGARFRDNVKQYRTMLAPEEMEGQFYDGIGAASRHFTHGTRLNSGQALAALRAL